MSTERIHKGDVLDWAGVFQKLVNGAASAHDISSATVREVRFTRPDGTQELFEDVDFEDDGTDGILLYRNEKSLLNVAGYWYVQWTVEGPSLRNSVILTGFEVLDVPGLTVS